MSKCWHEYDSGSIDGRPPRCKCGETASHQYAWGYNACRAVAVEKMAEKELEIDATTERFQHELIEAFERGEKSGYITGKGELKGQLAHRDAVIERLVKACEVQLNQHLLRGEPVCKCPMCENTKAALAAAKELEKSP